jgi:hypothetical protein
LLYAGTSSTLTRLNAVAVGKALLSDGIGVAPRWGQVDLVNMVTGVLAVANGGTGQMSYTHGNILMGSSTGSLVPASVVAGNRLSVSFGIATMTFEVDNPTMWYLTEEFTGATCPGATSALPGASVRRLNAITSVGPDALDVSLNTVTNVFTMAAGTYDFDVSMPGYNCGWFLAALALSTGGDYEYGSLGVASAIVDAQGLSFIKKRVVLAGPTTFVINHYAQFADPFGLGWCMSTGYVRKYTQVVITKIG